MVGLKAIFMKALVTGLFVTVLLATVTTESFTQLKVDGLVGVWETGTDQKMTKIVTPEFFSIAVYKGNEFVSTAGGRWRIEGKNIIRTYEFNTANPELVGTEETVTAELKKNKLSVTNDGSKQEWTRLDDGTPGQLAGAWLITGRMRNGEISRSTPGARRTMKILSGSRFQWIAYNVETKEFFGTGGGTYTTVDGKYTENILFFSRDSSRVGASLQFDFSLEDGDWRHKGLSSRGEPLDEIWTKREKIGL